MFYRTYKIVIIIAALITISGCAGMADAMSKMAGVGVISEEKSTFDGATIVKMSPAWLYAEGSWGNRVKLGAHWSNKSSEYVALILSYNSDVSSAGSAYIGLSGIDINIDGNIKKYTANTPTSTDSSSYNTVSRTIYTESKNSVVIPYSVLKMMVSAKDCRLRIHTGKGYEDSQFSIERIPGGQGTAILPMREFIKKVDSIKSQG